MKHVKLSLKEYEVLSKVINPNDLSKFKVEKNEQKIVFNLPLELADRIRNDVSDYLTLNGFDEEYKPTEEGIILEGLVDKLYID